MSGFSDKDFVTNDIIGYCHSRNGFVTCVTHILPHITKEEIQGTNYDNDSEQGTHMLIHNPSCSIFKTFQNYTIEKYIKFCYVCDKAGIKY